MLMDDISAPRTGAVGADRVTLLVEVRGFYFRCDLRFEIEGAPDFRDEALETIERSDFDRSLRAGGARIHVRRLADYEQSPISAAVPELERFRVSHSVAARPAFSPLDASPISIPWM
jgi:hypothetical protein